LRQDIYDRICFKKNFRYKKNDREIKKIRKWVEKINALEESLDKLSNKDIVLKAQDLYFRVNQNEHTKQAIIEGEMVEELIEAFALVR
jgi:preprotein translocase subunit SecA